MTAHPRLLSPLRLGGVTLRNRVVSTAHGAFTDFYRPGEPPDRYVAYQERRARGGCGFVILQPLHVHPSSQALGHHVHDPDHLQANLAVMAERLHAHDVPLVVQLIHFGAEFSSDARTDLQPLWGFSPVVAPSTGERAHAMSDAQVREVIDAFATTAALVVEAGIDGVELHAAHGYLLHQSVSPWANQRDDRWGDHRSFLVEVLRATRDAVGEALVGLRVSLDDGVPATAGGLGPAGLRAVAADMAATGMLDWLNTSWGSRAAHYATAVGGYEHPHGMFEDLVVALRAAVGTDLPLIGAGRVVHPDMAERWLADDVCDLVAMTRAQIADPDVVAKTAIGRADRIRPCVGANQGCVDRMEQALPITCFHNPDVGREYRQGRLQLAPASRRVLVVGAGPAGMRAAATAGRRGHRVRLVDVADRLGGRLRWATSFGPARELVGAIDWLRADLDEHGVTVDLRTWVDEDLVLDWEPDAVVVATGSVPADPPLPGIAADVDLWTTDHAMVARAPGGQVVVVDHLGTHEAAQAATRLAMAGAPVTLVTPGPVVAANVGFTHLRAQRRLLVEAGVDLRPMTRLRGVADGIASLETSTTRERTDITDVAAVVAAVPRLAADGLATSLGLVAPGIAVHLAGDAVAPRTAMHAFREGDDAGRAA